MNLGIIVLCRYNSSRLPGKILRQINGKPILSYILERLSKVELPTSIVVATSEEESDNPIVEYCKQNKINYFQGSLNNVASRFLECAKAYGFDYVFRINGDNIFVDIDLMNKAIHEALSNKYQFISNIDKRTFPKGMSVEGVSVPFYGSKIADFTDYEKEHIMPYFYNHASEFDHLYIYNTRLPEMAGIQLAIDTQEDFDLAEFIISKFNRPHYNYGMKEISTILNGKFK